MLALAQLVLCFFFSRLRLLLLLLWNRFTVEFIANDFYLLSLRTDLFCFLLSFSFALVFVLCLFVFALKHISVSADCFWSVGRFGATWIMRCKRQVCVCVCVCVSKGIVACMLWHTFSVDSVGIGAPSGYKIKLKTGKMHQILAICYVVSRVFSLKIEKIQVMPPPCSYDEWMAFGAHSKQSTMQKRRRRLC